MKHRTPDDEFCLYTDGNADAVAHPLGRLGVSRERRAVSLTEDGIAFVAGIGHTRYTVVHTSLPEHVHPGCIELHYCLAGSMEFEIDGIRHALLPGEVCVTQPDTRHHLVSNAKGHRHYWMLVKLPSVADAANVFGLPPAEARELRRRICAIRRPVFDADERLQTLFKEVFDTLETMRRGTYRTFVLRTLVLRILTMLVRDAGRRTSGRIVPTSIGRIVDDIRRRPETRRTVAEMARASGRCESGFNTDFKRATGFPPAAFIANCRIEKSRELLRSSSMAIAAIAQLLGYSSPAHFTAQFRLFCGISPREFRRGGGGVTP